MELIRYNYQIAKGGVAPVATYKFIICCFSWI